MAAIPKRVDQLIDIGALSPDDKIIGVSISNTSDHANGTVALTTPAAINALQHDHTVSDITDFITGVNENDLVEAATTHITDEGNPHNVSLAQVGGTTNHTELSNIGTNTHAQIDTHIASTSNPHGVTAAQVGKSTAQWNADKIQGVTVDDAAKADGKILAYKSGSGKLEYVAPLTGIGSGDVVGPASSVDNTIARFDGVTGKLIQDSGITIGDDVLGEYKMGSPLAILIQPDGGLFLNNTHDDGIIISNQSASGSVNIFSDNGVTVDGVVIDTGLVDGVDVSAHAGDATTHFTQASISIPSTQISDWAEAVSDTAGAMVTGNTETNITVTYQDADNTIDFVVANASTTAKGAIEIAIDSEVNTGTDATRAVSPDSLAGSNFGERGMQFIVVAPTTDVATGTGLASTTVPTFATGMNLVAVHARVITAGTTGVTTIDVNKNGTSMLSTKLTIDSGETGSNTAATAAVINTAADDVASYDLISIDVDGVSTTAPKGLIVTLEFRLP